MASFQSQLSKFLQTAVISGCGEFLASKIAAETEINDELGGKIDLWMVEFIAEKTGHKTIIRGPTGYNLFYKEHKEQVVSEFKEEKPGIKITIADLGQRMSKLWEAADQLAWDRKAMTQNQANGLPVSKSAQKRASKASSTASSTVSEPTEQQVDEALFKIAKNDQDMWVIEGTNFVCKSDKIQEVIGACKNGKIAKLTAVQKATCAKNGYPIA